MLKPPHHHLYKYIMNSRKDMRRVETNINGTVAHEETRQDPPTTNSYASFIFT